MMVDIWKQVGFNMVIYLAGLQLIDKVYYEAAELDGATYFDKLRYITLPRMVPSVIINLLLNMSQGLKTFDIVYVLTNGGPNNATQVLSTYMYTQTFRYNNLGYGAAISIVMVLMMMVIVVPYIIATTKED